jgi:hypothetical protein
MGRHIKEVASALGIDRREAGYYATPAFVAQFMAKTLTTLKPDAVTCLDPAIGQGELALPLVSNGVKVDGFDIHDFDAGRGISFTKQDFLHFYRLHKIAHRFPGTQHLQYDLYVANPPYNCHELDYIRRNKAHLSSIFEEVGVLNMYSMFLSAIIDLARPGAFIGFITLDSFLTARGHEALRRQILGQCSVHYLILCPNDLFRSQGADVRTCILILEKNGDRKQAVKLLNRLPDTKAFETALIKQQFMEASIDALLLSGDHDGNEFTIGLPDEIRNLFSCRRLGQTYRCATGISTGNDGLHLSPSSKSGFTIPFYKNPGSSKFFARPNAFLRDDFLAVERTVKNFMVRNKDLLYQPGIICSSMGVPFSACYLPEGSTWGVNTRISCGEDDLWWLLGYLNSGLVTFIVRAVLNRSNMVTSGYISRIPLPSFSTGTKEKLGRLARQAYSSFRARGSYGGASSKATVGEMNELVNADLDISLAASEQITEFAATLSKKV